MKDAVKIMSIIEDACDDPTPPTLKMMPRFLTTKFSDTTYVTELTGSPRMSTAHTSSLNVGAFPARRASLLVVTY